MRKAQLSQLPELRPDRKSLVDFHNKFVKYFIDNFGFRNTLIRWNSLLRLKFLKVESFPRSWLGKDDWLYLIKDDDGNNALDYYRVTRPFADEREIADGCSRFWRSRNSATERVFGSSLRSRP